jgi:succinyl-CoA synthetase beta subunit
MGGGAGGQAGMAEMTAQMLEDPNVREQMINVMTQPGMMDMIAASNPQLSQMINSMPPMVRQTMQNPEMLRAMLNPDMLRMMSQFGGGMVSLCSIAGSSACQAHFCTRWWQPMLCSCWRARGCC